MPSKLCLNVVRFTRMITVYKLRTVNIRNRDRTPPEIIDIYIIRAIGRVEKVHSADNYCCGATIDRLL